MDKLNLTSEEEFYLREALVRKGEGQPLQDYVYELADRDPLAVNVFAGLLAKRAVTGSAPSGMMTRYRFDDFTSAGRCYFDDLEDYERRRALEREEDRRRARRDAVIAFLASSAVTLAVNMPSLCGWVSGLLGLRP